MDPIAHGPDHRLVEHLQSVADSAAQCAPPGAREWARLAGLWHDLGKFRPGFQRYIRQDENAHIESRASRAKTHSAAGALHALRSLQTQFGATGGKAGWLLAHLIAAHHAGLYDAADLKDRLLGSGKADSDCEHDEAIAACRAHAASLLAVPPTLDPRQALAGAPGLREGEPLAQTLWLRMLFSALVDADFLDTEAYMDRGKASHRCGFPPLTTYLTQIDAYLQTIHQQVAAAGRAHDPVMQARQQVLADCRTAAAQPPGVFSLQVPTGGGKTLASLAFALGHAVEHGLQRVIVAIPYTSIVEQTADVLAGVFGSDNVVEHHSQADGAASAETARSRLACENWDAPLIITTNVQLFESLFAARTSRCRKLHRIQRSVIVLDEAQTLPPPFLQPTLDALRLLVSHYGVTLVSCTATQPVLSEIRRFDPRASLRGLTHGGGKICEIVRHLGSLYTALERVTLHWPQDLHAPEEIASIAKRAAAESVVLAVVNTRKDAAALVHAIDAATADSEPTLHLSAAMCGQHRADVIHEIRRRLDVHRQGETRPLRVVATQLVEAGVDIDFPVVFRALAGLDSIAQAAGRCNREGHLGARGGRVVIFVRPIPAPLTALQRAVQAALTVLGDSRPPTLSPELFTQYFTHWYAQFDPDERKLLPMLKASADFDVRLRSAADAYRLIDNEDQAAVVVPYRSDAGADEPHAHALAALLQGSAERRHLRVLQRRVVQARSREILPGLARGDFIAPMPGWFVLKDELRYSKRFGLTTETALDTTTLVQ